MLQEIKKKLFDEISLSRMSPELPHRNFISSTIKYFDTDYFQKEITSLKPFPMNLGPGELLEKNGKYLVSKSATDLKLFYNACPHRGAKLSRIGSEYHCSYHGWRFAQNGKLEASTGHVCPYPPNSLKLKEVKGSAIGGTFFTGELKEGKFTNEICHLTEGSRFIAECKDVVKCNWKFLVESLLETYHFPFAHKSILGNFENAFHSVVERDGDAIRILVPLSDPASAVIENNFKSLNIMYYIFPFSFILMMESGFVWFLVRPVSEKESVFERYLFSSGQSTDGARQSFDLLDKILEEDFEILESQQNNVHVMERFFYTGYEKGIEFFHASLRNSLNKY